MADNAAHSDADANADTSLPVINCDVLEAAKENIQPIAKGRRVTALSAILATPHAQRDSRLAATRDRHRLNVQLALDNSTADEGDEDEDDTAQADLLEAYCTFVNWVVENYPQGHSAESGLLELLEEATRVLKDHQGGKWRNDMRYLKLWVLYATYVEKPTIIFKFCLVNEIGTDHALLYEELALALERAGRKTEADEAYLLGIARRVDPLERLEAKYREFQKRMMTTPNLPAAAATTPTPSAPTPEATPATRRAALNDSSSSTSVTRRVTRASSRLNASASSSTPLTTAAAAPARAQPNARIAVFVDTPTTDASSSSRANNVDDAPSAWPELGTRKSRIKENVKEATKAAGTTLRQAARPYRSTPKISVFIDPEDGDAPGPAQDTPEMPSPPLPTMHTKTPIVKSTKAIAVLRDDTADMPPEPKKAKIGKGIAVFVDAGSTPAAAGSSKSAGTKRGAVAVFRDDAAESPVEPKRKVSSKAKAKEPMAVFRDDAQPAETSPETVRTEARPPAFMPFKDDEAEPAAANKEKPVGLGILGLGGAATKGAAGVKMSTEGEALRRDPLKNYPDDLKTAGLD